jgi:hypothetical protein
MIKINAISIARHRNGVSGAPFYLCRFTAVIDDKKHTLQAVLFEEKGHCAVTEDDMDQCWRGDHFESKLRILTDAWEKTGGR